MQNKKTNKENKKKEKVIELHPTMEINNNFSKNLEELQGMVQNNEEFVEIQKPSSINEIDNIFRAIVSEFFNSNNISLKTEYVSLNENFAGAKLEFLSVYANVPLMHNFLNTLEIKRVSLNRKSRIEMIKVFERRDEEINSQMRTNNMKMMGMV